MQQSERPDPGTDLEAAVRALVAQGDDLARAIDRQTRSQTRSQRWLVVVGLVVVVVLAVVAVDTRRAVYQLGLRLCPIVEVLVPQPGEPTPTPGRSEVVAGKAEQLSRDLHC